MSSSTTDATPATAPEPPVRAGVRSFSVGRALLAFAPLAILGTMIALELPICPTRTLLGIPCPGCGLTRATQAIAVGDVHGMLRYHPLAPIVSPIFAFVILRATLVGAGLWPKDRFDLLAKLPNWAWTTLGVALIGLWVLRLLGFLGGLPDPVDPTAGFLYRGARGLWILATGG